MTVTTSGAGKAVSTPVHWPLPEVTVMVNPLDSKVPMSVAPDVGRGAPRWSVVTPLPAVPAPMAALPGKSAMVSVGPL
jgi:hypothetical protein